MMAGIPALIPQGLLVGPEIIPMGGKVVGCRVERKYISHMGCYKVVESANCSGDGVLWGPGRLGLQAKHGADVFFAFWDREVTPVWGDLIPGNLSENRSDDVPTTLPPIGIISGPTRRPCGMSAGIPAIIQ